ncbi:recombinase family protein [Salipiger pallidus]|uniref:recombinase family protein n=1 Tax=Salipiger pallidus TaxID=1775170 RepID=UPI0016667A5B
MIENEAATVRRFFEGYAAGLSARALAAALNAEGICSPATGENAGNWAHPQSRATGSVKP